MANNEHKNLSNANLHVPLDFAGASASTVLTKNSDSNLAWQSETVFRKGLFTFQGYGTAPSGGSTGYYLFRAAISDAQSDFEMNQDYGSGTISSSNKFDVSNIFRTGGFPLSSPFTFQKITGWCSSNGSPTITMALCRITPEDDVADDLTPTVIAEWSITGNGNDNLRSFALIGEHLTTITGAEGDIIFPMVKSDTASSSIYFNYTVEGIITL